MATTATTYSQILMPLDLLVLSFVSLGKVGVEMGRSEEVRREKEVEGGRVRGVDVGMGV